MKKKFLVALLLCLCITTCLIGLIGCDFGGNDESSNHDDQIMSIYNTYKVYAEDNGTTPLSYDEWLKTIKGKDGKAGKDGLDGLNGKDGVGVKTIFINNEGHLIFFFTDGNFVDVGVVKGQNGQAGKDDKDGQDGTDGVGIADMKIENGKLYVKYTNGVDYVELGQVLGADGKDGQDGADGVGIADMKIENGKLYVKYTNGVDYVELGQVLGADGKDGSDGKDGQDGTDGVGIADMKIENGKLYVKYTNGVDYVELGQVLGADGKDGSDGQDGQDGTDGVGIADMKIENGKLYVKYTNGANFVELGQVLGADGQDGTDGVGIADMKIENGKLYVKYTNGVDYVELGQVLGVDGKDGQDGTDGVGIADMKIENGKLYVKYTNGVDYVELGQVLGVDGKDGQDGTDGVGIADMKIENGKLYVKYTNGVDYVELGQVLGADGKDGSDGKDGQDGTDGVGIADMKIENGKLYVKYTNAVNYVELGQVLGADGKDGSDGKDGQDGKDGSDGKDGQDGQKGDNGLSAYEIFKKNYPDYEGTEKEWIYAVATGDVCSLFGHAWDEGEITIPATKEKEGEKTYTCLKCSETKTEVIPKIAVAEAEIYENDGVKYVNFGKYPQTHVSDETLILNLNKLTQTNDFGYYEYDGKEYAKLVSKPYTYGSYKDSYGETQYYTYSDGGKIKNGIVEWFLVEPIKWRILSDDGNDNYKVVSELILNASGYYKNTYIRKIDGVDVYSNNYKYSDIREFLNTTFINSAFTSLQQDAIITTEVDNSATSTGYSSNSYACENTYDKVYLLSHYEALQSGCFKDNVDRCKKVTDYAIANGAYYLTSAPYEHNDYWWLRSPYYGRDDLVSFVNYDGWSGLIDVYDTGRGVVPALQISL